MWQRFKDFFTDVMERIESHHLELVSGGVAFYSFLAVFPAIATCISLYGLIADAQTVRENIQIISPFLPSEVKDLIFTRMTYLAENQNSSLTFGLIVGTLLSLWSANRAMKAIAKGLNITYERKENRGFIKFNLITLSLTLISSLVFILVVAVAVIIPVIVNFFIGQSFAKILTSLVSWAILISVVMGLFVILYRFAPDLDKRPRIRKTIPGAVFATLIVTASSVAFSFYVKNFGSYNEEYGAISAVVITLLWLYLVSFVFLLGAEFNARKNKEFWSN